MQNKWLRSRIVVTAALVCGQTKSKGFADHLIRLTGADPRSVKSISFRDKTESRPAIDYVFSSHGPEGERKVSYFPAYREAYTSGQFKLNCCNFCDDVFGEVADVAFMDAWLPSVWNDPRGTSIVITRMPQIEQIFLRGRLAKELDIRAVPLDEVVLSQDGVLADKRHTLAERLWLARANGMPAPEKRIKPREPRLLRRLLLARTETLRSRSREGYARLKADPVRGLAHYRRFVRPALLAYRFWKWYIHRVDVYFQAVLRRLRRLLPESR